jgi:hypothetical protein
MEPTPRRAGREKSARGRRCGTRVDAVIMTYMHRGWTALTQLFQQHAGTPGKEKTLSNETNNQGQGQRGGGEGEAREYSLALKMLSAIREYVVHDAFRCARPAGGTTYSAYGSTHITSDYDVSVQGRDAARVTWEMFERFWNMYRRTLDYSFDTNIYCVPMFVAQGIHPALRPRCVTLKRGGTAVFVTERKEYPIVLPAAASKLLTRPLPALTPWPHVSALLGAAAKFKRARDAELASAVRAAPCTAGDAATARVTYARYVLQCAHGAAALRTLYAPAKTRVSATSLLESLILASYFAVEAYYTPDAVNVVVVGLQRREHVRCDALSYVCSALENLGDLRLHAGDELASHGAAREAGNDSGKELATGLAREPATSKDPRTLLLKYSKYVHRILHSLEGFGARGSPRAAWYEEHVLKHRSAGDVGRVPWTAAGYRGTSVKAYVDALTVQVLQAVEAWMAAHSLQF